FVAIFREVHVHGSRAHENALFEHGSLEIHEQEFVVHAVDGVKVGTLRVGEHRLDLRANVDVVADGATGAPTLATARRAAASRSSADASRGRAALARRSRSARAAAG